MTIGRHRREDRQDVDTERAEEQLTLGGSPQADRQSGPWARRFRRMSRPKSAPDGAPSGADGTDRQTPKKKSSFWKELPILIVIALVLTFLIQTFLARVYVIPSGSMEKTLDGYNGNGDRILVDKVVYDFHDPHPGDVVVFKGPPGWDQNEFTVSGSSNVFVHWLRQFGAAIGIGKPDEYDLVKRVIAVGGQTVSCCDNRNRLMVDGKALDEPYVYYESGHPNIVNDRLNEQAPFGPVTIPAGDIWVMGDNRNNSLDSRYQNGGGINGVVPVSDVIGKARTVIWPPSRWQGIGDHNPQRMALGLGDSPAWTAGLPAGAGIAAAWPVLWIGRRLSGTLRRNRSRRR